MLRTIQGFAMGARRVATPVAAAAGMLLLGAPAAADTEMTFFQLEGVLDLSGQFVVAVSEGQDAGRVDFTFYNNGPISSSITDVYWESTYAPYINFALDPAYFHSGGNASNPWDFSASPGELSGGQNAQFTAAGGGTADSSPPPTANGVQVNENIRFNFALAESVTYASLIEALYTGDLRLGIHVQSQAGDGSASYLTTNPAAVPIPPAAALGLLGMACAAGMNRLRQRKSSKA